jgi:hypothetical protein
VRIEAGQRTEAVMAAIAAGAARTGADFGLLMAQARVESGLRPDAAARGSSARGLFQFTAGTWLEMMKRHGAALGLSDGPGDPDRLLKLREDPLASSLMAGALAADNRAVLERRLGRAVDAVELHLAHFLGAGGAARFLTALSAAPAMAAAIVVPAAAAANRAIFYAGDGSPRSLADVKALMAARLGLDLGRDGSVLPVSGKDLPAEAAPAASPAASPALGMVPGMAPVWAARLLLAQLAG